jgi:hypothetical protein
MACVLLGLALGLTLGCRLVGVFAFWSVSGSGMTAVCLSLATHWSRVCYCCCCLVSLVCMHWCSCPAPPRAVLCCACELQPVLSCCLVQAPGSSWHLGVTNPASREGAVLLCTCRSMSPLPPQQPRTCGAALGSLRLYECTAASTLQHPPPVGCLYSQPLA